MAFGPEQVARIGLTVSCRDTDAIPKVAGAGRVIAGNQMMHNGVRVVEGCYHGDWMTEVIRQLGGHHEPQEEVVFHAIVERLALFEPSPVILELGAFWAYYALWVLQRLPSAQAFLVEPDPANLEVGRRNFVLNERQGTFLQAAVGADSRPPEPFPCESDGITRPVPVEGLASLFNRFGLGRADIVHVDVQGAELALLEGARDLLIAGRVRFLVVSTHHHVYSSDPLTHQRCLDLVRSAGGHVIAEHTVAESFSGDGVIAASFDARDRDLAVDISRCRAGDSFFGDPLRDLDKAQAELRVAASDLDAARREREEAASELARVQAEVAAVKATRTWRLHDRVTSLRKLSG